MNRLARERSPYLLQHAHNPVDWYPWGDEAFAQARAEDKPIFLSIGYSTCHWCHVMEHESFENDADRRGAQRALRRDQGRSRGAARRRSRLHDVRAGDDRLRRLADERVADAGAEAVLRRHLFSAGVEVGTARLRRHPAGDRAGLEGRARQGRRVGRGADRRGCERWSRRRRRRTCPGAAALDKTVQQFRDAFDPRNGGFGDAPKFPRPSRAAVPAARARARRRRRRRAEMVLRTLRAMALGGMRDHIGGGFHRYSVDGDWRVPHFEKMLYDQAQLVLAFVEAAQVVRRSVLRARSPRTRCSTCCAR